MEADKVIEVGVSGVKEGSAPECSFSISSPSGYSAKPWPVSGATIPTPFEALSYL
jgi:hypothetical protein